MEAEGLDLGTHDVDIHLDVVMLFTAHPKHQDEIEFDNEEQVVPLKIRGLDSRNHQISKNAPR